MQQYINEISAPDGTRLQDYQRATANFLNVDSGRNRLFLYHEPGSGKTIQAILVAENFRNKYLRDLKSKNPDNRGGKQGFIYIIAGGTPIANFKKELTGKWGNVANHLPPDQDNIFISHENRQQLEHLREIMLNHPSKENVQNFKRMNSKYIRNVLHDAGYRFISYQKLLTYDISNFSDSLVIVDEAHNLFENEYTRRFLELTRASQRYKLLLLSATPMVNRAYNIVSFSNLLFPENPIRRSDLFNSDGNLKSDTALIKRFYGHISYVRSFNEKFFPRVIYMGKDLPDLPQIRLIRIPMSPEQYETYRQHWHEKSTMAVKNIADFIFPPVQENSLPWFSNLESRIASLPIEYRLKWGIETYSKYGDTFVTGKFLELTDSKRSKKQANGGLHGLETWSPKFARLLENIIAEPYQAFVFSKFVNNSGIKLISEMLRRNGFIDYNEEPRDDTLDYTCTMTFREWKKKNKDGRDPTLSEEQSPREFHAARFMLYYKNIPRETQESVIRRFNSPENVDGRLIRVILGSELTKESLDLKRIRSIHVVNYQENMARLDQIYGRGIRYMSHDDLPYGGKYVRIYNYVISIPKKEKTRSEITPSNTEYSMEELEYIKDVREDIKIQHIQRLLKMSAVDCSFNRETNRLSSTYDYTRMCNYEKCDIPCIDSKIKEGKYDPIMYRLFYYETEMYNIFMYLKNLFIGETYVAISYILHNTSFMPDLIIYAINEFVRKRIKVTYSPGNDGYLIIRDGLLLFQPDKIADTEIDINVRIFPETYVSETTDLTDIVESLVAGREVTNKNIDTIRMEIEEIISAGSQNREKTMTPVIAKEIGNYLSLLNTDEKQTAIEWALEEYIVSPKQISGIIFIIMKYFKNYLIDARQKNFYNNYLDDQYFKSYAMTTKTSDYDFVGHIFGRVPRFYNTEKGQFEESCELFSLRHSRDLKPNAIAYGYIDKGRFNNLVFKIKETYSPAQSDLRRVKKGYVCENVNDKRDLTRLAKKLGLKNLPLKIRDICDVIETELRRRQLENDRAGGDTLWFRDYKF